MPNVGKRLLAAAGAAILATSLIGPSMAQDKPPIKIGLILPYTGFASFLIPFFETGFTLGIEDVNASGGINGSMLELQKEDTQFNPAEAIRVYKRLVRANAFATFGPISSTVWENITPLTEREKMPIINTTAQKPQISNSHYTLRMTSHDLKMMPEGVEQFVQLKPNVKKIVIMGDVKEQATKTALDSYDR